MDGADPQTGLSLTVLGGECCPLVDVNGFGPFTRYLADDYSTAGVLLRSGFWAAQSYWYYAWSGCYSYTFLVSLVEKAGLVIVPWLPMAALLVLIVSLAWTLRQFFQALGIKLALVWVVFLSNIIVFGTIKSFHEFQQVIFWQTGILSYQVNLQFFTIEMGIFIQRFILSPVKNRSIWEYLF